MQFDGQTAIVHLQGKDKSALGVASLLLLTAVLAALAAVFLPRSYALAAIFGLGVCCFAFNRWRQKTQNGDAVCINRGTICVGKGFLRTEKERFCFGKDAQFFVKDGRLVIKDGQKTWRVSGFERPNHAEVVCALLSGRALKKRHANVRLNETPKPNTKT